MLGSCQRQSRVRRASTDALDGRAFEAADQSKSTQVPHWKDQLFLIAIILMSCTQWLFPGADLDAGTGSPLANFLWLAAYAFSLVALASARERALRLLRASLPLLCILLLACLSTLWSDRPDATARRAAQLLGTTTLAFYFVYRLGLSGFVETLARAIALVAIISALLIVFLPNLTPNGELEGGWVGLFSHRNPLGLLMVLGLVTTGCTLERSRGLQLSLRIATLPLFCILLIGSRSVGGYTSALALGLIFLLLRSARRQRKLIWPMVLASVAFAAVMLLALLSGFGLDDALGIFGRDSTLTGRTTLWSLVMSAITERPALGYGYGVFWGFDGPAGTLIYPGINWVPASAHNGFLEVALNLGLVGELALLAFLLAGLRMTWSFFWRGRDTLSLWPLFAWLSVILANLSEATFTAYNLVDWIVLVTAFLFAADNYGANTRPYATDGFILDPHKIPARTAASAPSK